MVVAVATMVKETDQPTAKTRLKSWVKDKIEGERSLRAPDVATLAVDELSLDRGFLADFGKEMLRTAVYELVLDVIAEGRALHHEVSVLDGPQSEITPTRSTDTRANVKRRLALLERRYSSWYEHVGDQHIAFLEMTAPQLELAEKERRARGTHEIRLADFLGVVRKRLEGQQRVRERFTDLAQLDFIRSACMDKKGEGK